MFDIYTIIFLALAVFIFLRLRSVLGQRTGRERPPYDPYSARDAVRGATNDNVVTLPGPRRRHARKSRSRRPSRPSAGRVSPRRARRRPVGLDAIVREDKTFDAKHFVAGARAAYEMIVLAYAEGDRRTLKNLLSRDVYEGFEAAIRERESKGETVETRFVAIDKSDITGAELRGAHGADHGPLRLAAHLGHPRQVGQRHRRQPGKGHRRHRRVDLRARPLLARSQLEARRHRSRAITGAQRGMLVRLCALLGSIAAAATLALAGMACAAGRR